MKAARLKKAGLVVLFVVARSTAWAQQDPCALALTATGRNNVLQFSQRDREAYFYRKVCEATSSGANLNTNGEYFEVAKGMLGFSYSTAKQYCEAEQKNYKDYQFDYLQTSTVAEAALASWVSCLQITRAGITTTPQGFKDRAVITLERTTANVGVVRGVFTNEKTVCTGQLVAANGTPTLTTLGPATSYTLPTAEKFQITCLRAPRASPGPPGSMIYPGTAITVGTSLGPFTLVLDPEPVGPEIWASEIERKIDALNKRVTEESAKAAAATAALEASISGKLANLDVQVVASGATTTMTGDVRCTSAGTTGTTVIVAFQPTGLGVPIFNFACAQIVVKPK